MPNPHGRPKGSKNKATREREAMVAASGKTPLEVMIEIMRFHHKNFEDQRAALELIDDVSKDPDVIAARELAKDRLNVEASLTLNAAKDAAPYVHAKLTSTQVTGKDEGPIEISDARSKLEHLIAVAAQADEENRTSKTAH